MSGTKFLGIPSNQSIVDKRSALASSRTDFITEEEITDTGKWLYYKALITEGNSENPVARVLNADAQDFLGYIAWTYAPTTCTGTLQGAFPEALVVFLTPGYIVDGYITVPVMERTSDDAIAINDRNFTDMYVEVRVRKRGDVPAAPTAKTDDTGSKVILTFAEEMNRYMFADIETAFTVSGGRTVSSVAIGSDPKTIELTVDTAYEYDDTITVAYDATHNLETLKLGLVAEFDAIPVTNMVVEPPALVSGSVAVDGLSVTLVFDRPMRNPVGADINLAFELSVNAEYITAGTLEQTSPTELKLSDLEQTIYKTNTITLDRDAEILVYNILSSIGGYLGTITGFAITNNSDVTAP